GESFRGPRTHTRAHGRRMFLERLEPRRLFSAGALDTSFGNGGLAPLPPFRDASHQIVLMSDGRVVALMGNPFSSFSPGGSTVARYTRGGQLDLAFGGGDGMIEVPVNAALAV